MLSLVKGILWLLILALLLAIMGRVFLFEIAQTDDGSMVPNILPGDIFLVLTRGQLGPGDIALCEDPEDSDRMVVGRILGVPGSTFEMRDNTPRVDGKALPRAPEGPKVVYEDTTGGERVEHTLAMTRETVAGRAYHVASMERARESDFRETHVERGFFLVSDNRSQSRDSRQFGEVPSDACIGRPFLVLWPGPDSGDFKFENRFMEWIH